jgi:hypothetical protein
VQCAMCDTKHWKDSNVKNGVGSCLVFLNSSLDDYDIFWLYVVYNNV